MSARLALMAVVLPALAFAEEPGPWSLDALTEAARRVDPRVAMASADLGRLRGLQQEADAARFPQISLFGAAGAPVPEARNDPSHVDAVTPVSRLRNWQLGHWGVLLHAEGTFALPLYTFGKIAAYRAAAAAGVAATDGLLAAARDQAEHDAAEVFWGYQLAREILAGLDEAERELVEGHQRVERLLGAKSPQVSRSDLARLDLIHAELKARRSEALSGLELALVAGRLLAGVPSEAPFALAERPLAGAPVELLPMERYQQAAAASRPEIGAAQRGVEARAELVHAKEREFYPDLLAVAGFNVNSSDAATPQTNPFAYDPYNGRTIGAGLGVRWTFDVPQKRAALAQAEADLDKARAEQHLALSGVRLQVAQAYTSLRAAMERADRYDEQHAAARRWLTAAGLSFDSGVGDAQETMLAALATAYAQGQALQARREAHVAMADLKRATGIDPRQVK